MISLATSNSALSRWLCLLFGQYYHSWSDTCIDPFIEESCDPGYTLLWSVWSVPGEVKCQDSSYLQDL